MSFGYLRDPLFLTCFSIYWIHRVLSNCQLSPIWSRAYLNDLICIPFWIPIMLWCQRVAGIRTHDDPPQAHEVVIPLIVWAVVFEAILPATDGWSDIAVPDPNDILCYALGAVLAVVFWRARYGHLPAGCEAEAE